MPTDTPIVPPVNSTTVDISTREQQNPLSLVMSYGDESGDEIDLLYSSSGTSMQCNVSISVVSGWTIIPAPGSPITWSNPGGGSVWIANVPASVIAAAREGRQTEDSFTFRHVSGQSHDPRIVVEREN